MYYYRRRKRTPISNAMWRYFGVIVEDIKSYFFKLPKDSLEELFNDYSSKYGYSAGDYARKVYPSWQRRSTQLSTQTLMRLIETLPYFLSEEQRLHLLEKLFNKHVVYLPQIRIVKTLTWDNYSQGLTEVEERIRKDTSNYCRPSDFKDDILKFATWLSQSDMNVAKRILGNMYTSRYQLQSVSAIADVRRFRKLLDELKSRELIYDNRQNLSVSLPLVSIDVEVMPKSKPFMKALRDFFG